MRLGFSLPVFGKAAATPGGIARYAREAEQAGAAGLWVGDRLLSPVAPVVPYPGYDTMPEEFHTAHDPFTALAVAAAVTETAVLGSSTINATQYQPANFARLLTSLDVAANGRLLPGLGIGWSPDEYAAVGIPMSERGKRLDDLLDLLETWWTKDTVAHEGVGYAIAESHVAPQAGAQAAGAPGRLRRKVAAPRRRAGRRLAAGLVGPRAVPRGRAHLHPRQAPRRRREAPGATRRRSASRCA